MGIKVKQINKYLIACFLFFLPFTNVLVVNLGFPLKISEIFFFGLLLFNSIFITRSSFWKSIKLDKTDLVLLIFLLIVFISTLLNSFWEYSYNLNYYEDVRLGYKFDSFLKLFYVVLAIIVYFICKNNLKDNFNYFIKSFLYGGLIACFFCWYLFIASILEWKPYFFNSSLELPQQFFIPLVGSFYRSGTFREGNHMGLFLLVSVFISHQLRSKFLFLFIITIITTFSTPAFMGCLTYFYFYYSLKNIKEKRFYKLSIVNLFLIATFIFILSSEYIQAFTINKLIETEEVGDTGSRDDRLELIQTGLRIAFNNPIIGVGLSNYALHYNHFSIESNGKGKLKRIANNVYVEILSEIGILAFIFFLLYLFLISLNLYAVEEKIGFAILLIYFNVYPTFTLLFIWFYFSYLSFKKNNYNAINC